MSYLPKQVETLWTLFTAPVVWALHFLACYVVMAIFCAKVGGEHTVLLQLILLCVTLCALGFIVFAAYLAWRQWGFGTDNPPHDSATHEDRLLFQGFATLLLSGLSFVAVIFTALPLLFIRGCFP